MPIANVYNDEGGTGREVGADVAQVTQVDDFSTLCNGENVRFTTTQNVTSGSLNVYLNGLKQRVSNISIIDDRNFEFSTAPLTGEHPRRRLHHNITGVTTTWRLFKFAPRRYKIICKLYLPKIASGAINSSSLLGSSVVTSSVLANDACNL